MPRRPDARTGLVAALWAVAALAVLRVALQTRDGFLALGAATAQDMGTVKDFRDAAYFPVRELLRPGGMPYDPQSMFVHWPVVQEFDLYLPFHLLLHLPFALLSYPVACVAQFALNVGLLVVLCRWSVRWAVPHGLPERWASAAVPALLAVLVTSQVGKAQLQTGQVNPLVALGVAGALTLRHRRWTAAVCLALAWIKPQYGVPLTALLLVGDAAHRRTAVLGTAIAGIASLPVVAVLVGRAGGVAGFVDVLRANVDYASANPQVALTYPLSERVDVLSVVARTLGWTPPGPLEVLVPLLVVALTGLGVRALRRAGGPGAAPVADLLCLAGVLAALVHQPGDALAALPATVATGVVAWRHRRRLAGLAALLMLVPFADIHAVTTAVTALAGRQAALTLDGVAVTACWLVLLVLAGRAALAARRSPLPDVDPQEPAAPRDEAR